VRLSNGGTYVSVIGKKAFDRTKSFLSRGGGRADRHRRHGIIDRVPSDVWFSSCKDAKSSFYAV